MGDVLFHARVSSEMLLFLFLELNKTHSQSRSPPSEREVMISIY